MDDLVDDLTLDDFKSDLLFDKIKNAIDEPDKLITEENSINLENLKEYLNKEGFSNYAISNKISKYMQIKEIDFGYFRVVKRYNGESKEAFPFSSITFNQLIDCDWETNEVSFSESKFKEEVERKFKLFVLEIKDEKIIEIQLLDDFTFEKYISNAEKAFALTKKCFEEGDETLFPKTSLDINFHVRPKAANADDTFEFTNGQEITKRTFWVNRKTLNQEINSRLKKQEGCVSEG